MAQPWHFLELFPGEKKKAAFLNGRKGRGPRSKGKKKVGPFKIEGGRAMWKRIFFECINWRNSNIVWVPNLCILEMSCLGYSKAIFHFEN